MTTINTNHSTAQPVKTEPNPAGSWPYPYKDEEEQQ